MTPRETNNRPHVANPAIAVCGSEQSAIAHTTKTQIFHRIDMNSILHCTRRGCSSQLRALRSRHSPVFESCSSARYDTPISTANRTPNTSFQFIGQRLFPLLPRLAHQSTRFIARRPSKIAAAAIPTIQKSVCIFAPRFAQPADFGTVAYNRARPLRVSQSVALRNRASSSIDIFPIHSV